MDDVQLRDLKLGDLGWLITENANHYAAADGFDLTFEGLLADVLGSFVREYDPDWEKAWIAERAGQRLGSIICTRHDAETARLKMFYLVPGARGLGLGKRLLSECMSFARAKGYQRMRLWTFESHRAAGGLYASFGWKLVDSKPTHNFGQDLVEQSWEFDF